jgi:hypothetical protein
MLIASVFISEHTGIATFLRGVMYFTLNFLLDEVIEPDDLCLMKLITWVIRRFSNFEVARQETSCNLN